MERGTEGGKEMERRAREKKKLLYNILTEQGVRKGARCGGR